MQRYLFAVTLVAILFFSFINAAEAQQTVFNVPSSDVLDLGTLYLENDWYLRPWKTDSDRAAATFVRGVAGIGKNVEVGINSGGFDLIHENNPFIDAVVKWRPFLYEFGSKEYPGTLALYGGTQFGMGVHGEAAKKGRNLTYGAVAVRSPLVKTRIGIGPYFATSRVFGGDNRGGFMATFEQPIPGVDGLVLAADWFSGDGAALTPGLIYTTGPVSLYLGYGLANTGRKDDLLTFELGVTLPLIHKDK